jgi:protein-S-isoprenylcysteine O-methyltransferase Ste14
MVKNPVSRVLRRMVSHYLVHLLAFGVFYYLLTQHSYYTGLLDDAREIRYFQYLFGAYVLFGLPYYFARFAFFTPSEAAYRRDKLVAIYDWFVAARRRTARRTQLWPAARTALLSYLVKAFFLPLMVSFLFYHIDMLSAFWHANHFIWSFDYFWTHSRFFLLNALFFVDVIIFTAAYTLEFGFLGNKIRSVDPYVSGWLVAIICYAPFSGAVSTLLPFPADIWGTPGDEHAIFKLLMLVFFTIYVWASVALGWRAGNLVNRGIVSRGPYAYVRHPAYTFKNLAWWAGVLPVLTPSLTLAVALWSGIYLLRALTEERHLMADPEYRAYCKQVKYRFIPGVI